MIHIKILITTLLLGGCATEGVRLDPLGHSDTEYICDVITGSHIKRCIEVDRTNDAGMSSPVKIYTSDDEIHEIMR